MKTWLITIIITDIKGEFTAATLAEDIKTKWLPVSHDIDLNELRVGMLSEKVNPETDMVRDN